jgi:hypothetical protein
MAVDYPALLAHSRALEAAASDHHDH